jgi:hypothetical protein
MASERETASAKGSVAPQGRRCIVIACRRPTPPKFRAACVRKARSSSPVLWLCRPSVCRVNGAFHRIVRADLGFERSGC